MCHQPLRATLRSTIRVGPYINNTFGQPQDGMNDERYQHHLADCAGGQHFERCRRTTPTSTMAVFVLPKWAKFNQLTKHWKLYHEFPARTQLFTRQSLENPAQQEVVALAPWHVQLWLVDVDCAFLRYGFAYRA
jgi:hypothetical protein